MGESRPLYGKNAAGQPFAFSNQAQKEVFSLDGVAAKLAGLVPCEEKYATGPFGIPFEHPASLGESRWCWGHSNSHHIIRHSYRSTYAIMSHKSLPVLGFPPHLMTLGFDSWVRSSGIRNEVACFETQDAVAGAGQARVVRRDDGRQPVGLVHLA